MGRRMVRIGPEDVESGEMSYVLGVDGGSTKTVALVARTDGTIVGAGRGGCANIYSGVEPALHVVASAVREALRAANVAAHDLEAGAFSMAGADWDDDISLIRTTMERHRFGRAVVVVNDALGALRAGSEDGIGVSVVCGTGAATGACGPDGRRWHSGFWQQSQGALDLGHQMLRAVYRAELGIDPPTALKEPVLRAFGQDSVEEVLRLFTARTERRPDGRATGQLAPLLLDTADHGDPTARHIVSTHGAALGGYALAAARRVGLDGVPFTLVLAGGVLRHPTQLLAEAIIARVRAVSPQVRPVVSRFEPAVGALFLALEQAGYPVGAAERERVATSLPPPIVFAS